MLPDVISQWFSKFLERNNLPKITLHEVRHTSISYLINKGVDIKKVADRAGHQNTRTTEEIYVTSMPKQNEQRLIYMMTCLLARISIVSENKRKRVGHKSSSLFSSLERW